MSTVYFPHKIRHKFSDNFQVLELVLQGCNGDIVRAIEHCLAVDDRRVDSNKIERPSYHSSESNSSNSLNPTTPTSPAEFFKNLTAPSRPFQGLPTFQPYMVSNFNIFYVSFVCSDFFHNEVL